MSERLALSDVDLLRRAERRWLEQAHERLRRPARRPHPTPADPVDPVDHVDPAAPADPEETVR